jgi:chaperonin GroES
MMDQDEDTSPDDLETNEDGSVDVELPEDLSDVIEMPDGSAVVSMQTKGPEESPDFYANMAEELDSYDLDSLGMRYVSLLDKDKNAREERDKQYEEGMKRTGLGKDAPGGANFFGASRAVHPVMAEGCVDFASRAIKELFPPDGPVRTKILGKVDDLKTERAERKRDFLNWQITEQIEEFRDEQEQMLTQLPLGGSQFLKLWYDEQKKRPTVEFVPIDRIILPFAASNFYTAQRAAEVHEITEWEYKRRVSSGMYIDTARMTSGQEPDQTRVQKANDKIEGKQFQENDDGLRKVYHIYVYLELEEDQHAKGESAPYIMMVDEQSSQVIGLYRNWEEGDETMTKLDWIIEFKFIPWRGAYAIGLPHLIGGLSAALTGALRALLDSAHINNAATMLKLKGAKVSGQTQQIEVTQVAEIEGAPGVDDIRKIAMPMPFNPPSPVLFELLGWLDNAAKGVVTTSEEKIADVNSNAPVGTTQALIEQGAAVYSAIHARLHQSQARLIKVLCRLNRWHFDEMRKGDIIEDLEVEREDFDRNTDVIPVSDPHIFSETQRMAQMQAVLQRADAHPDLYDAKAVEERFLKQIKIPNISELLKDVPAPEQRTLADENAAMSLGHPSYAYMQQDHIAHIQGHLMFGMDPNFGGNPFIAPQFLPNAIEHIKQHMTLWYLNRMNGYVANLRDGKPVSDYDDPKLTGIIDKLYATVGQHVALDSQQVFSQILPQLQQLMQAQQQSPQSLPLPPDAQVVKDTSMAETQRKAAKDTQDIQLAQAKMKDEQMRTQAEMQAKAQNDERDAQLKLQLAAMDADTKIKIENARLTHETIQQANQLALPPQPAEMPPTEGVLNGNQ